MSQKTASQRYICKCFLTNNIFIEECNLHVTYHSDKQFREDWEEVLISKGCSEKTIKDILQKVKNEVDRRRNLGVESLQRAELISTGYTPIHPHVYRLQESYFAAEFIDIVKHCRSDAANLESLKKRLHQEKAERVFSFPIFTPQFCQDFIHEICYFESSDLPKGRPNTMNNYGVLLNELGFNEQFVTPLVLNYLTPVTRILYPECGGASLDSHKAFVVKYKVDEDLSLAYHYDNAEVTLNVSLGKEFTEGSLYFGDMRWVPRQHTQYTEYTHKPTFALLHRGQHMHGAMPITDGERYNLIIWMRSSQVRNQLCPMCDEKPELVETVGFGDGFTTDREETVNVCAAL